MANQFATTHLYINVDTKELTDATGYSIYKPNLRLIAGDTVLITAEVRRDDRTPYAFPSGEWRFVMDDNYTGAKIVRVNNNDFNDYHKYEYGDVTQGKICFLLRLDDNKVYNALGDAQYKVMHCTLWFKAATENYKTIVANFDVRLINSVKPFADSSSEDEQSSDSSEILWHSTSSGSSNSSSSSTGSSGSSDSESSGSSDSSSSDSSSSDSSSSSSMGYSESSDSSDSSSSSESEGNTSSSSSTSLDAELLARWAFDTDLDPTYLYGDITGGALTASTGTLTQSSGTADKTGGSGTNVFEAEIVFPANGDIYEIKRVRYSVYVESALIGESESYYRVNGDGNIITEYYTMDTPYAWSHRDIGMEDVILTDGDTLTIGINVPAGAYNVKIDDIRVYGYVDGAGESSDSSDSSSSDSSSSSSMGYSESSDSSGSSISSMSSQSSDSSDSSSSQSSMSSQSSDSSDSSSSQSSMSSQSSDSSDSSDSSSSDSSGGNYIGGFVIGEGEIG